MFLKWSAIRGPYSWTLWWGGPYDEGVGARVCVGPWPLEPWEKKANYPDAVACFFPGNIVPCSFRFLYWDPPKFKTIYNEIFTPSSLPPATLINSRFADRKLWKKVEVKRWCLRIIVVLAVGHLNDFPVLAVQKKESKRRKFYAQTTRNTGKLGDRDEKRIRRAKSLRAHTKRNTGY